MDRNNVRPISVEINTTFLNCLQPEWSKYVTMVHHNQTGPAVSYDVLYDQLVQFEPHVLASRAKKASKNHDPLALISHSNASSSHSHTNSSYTPQSYYDGRIDIQTKNASYGGNANKNVGRNRTQGFNAGDESNQIIQRVLRTESTLGKANVQCYNCNEKAMKDEAGSNLINEEYDFMLDTSNGDELEELTTVVMLMARLQPADENAKNVPSYDAKAVSQLIKQKDLLQRELETFKDRVKTFKSKTIQYSSYKETSDELKRELMNDKDMIGRLVKEKEKVQNDFLKVKNEKIIIQHETQLEKKAFKEREDWYLDNILDLEEKLNSHDRNVYKIGKSIQTIHMLGKKPNKVYDPFLKAGLGYTNPVRLKKAIAAQPKMYDGDLIHNNKLTLSEIKEELIEEVQKMLNIFVSMKQKVNDKSPTENILENEIDRLLEASLTSEIQNCLLLLVEQQKHELLKVELEKSASDSRDIQANLLKRIKILENNFQRSQAQSIDFELKLKHQKEKMDCDVKLSTLHDENVLLKHQVESTVKERENIQLKFQKLFNSIKATRAQHQNEINEIFEDVTQKTYAYADVRAQNQDIFMIISELKSKLKTIDKGKHVNTKSKPVTSQSTPIIEQKQHNTNVIARGMYKINQEDTKTKDSKANTHVSNSTGVGSTNSVRRPKSKDNKSKNNVSKNIKSSSTYVLKTTNSVCLDSNKCETKPLNVCQTNACRTSSKTVNAVNDGLNMLCISCGLDVFLHSHEKCVARNALTGKYSVKRALFTSPITIKSKGLAAISVVAKSRFSVAKTPTATTKVSSVSPPSQKSSQSRILSSYMKNKIATRIKWQKWFEYQQGFNWTPKSKTAKSQSNVYKCRTSVIQLVLWIVDRGCSKHMTGNLQLLRNFIEKFMGTIRFENDHFAAITGYRDYVQGNLTICHVYYVEGLGHNLFLVGQFCDGDLEVAFRSNKCYVRNLEGDDLLTSTDIKEMDKNKDNIRQNRARDRKEHEITSPSVPSLLIGVAAAQKQKPFVAQFQAHISFLLVTAYELRMDDAPQIVSSSKDQVVTEPNSPVLNEVADEFVQEDVVDFDGHMFHNAPQTLEFDVAESSSTYQDPSNMHQFHQQHRSIDKWTKNHPLE
ncbi:hypothetical protein Tco_0385191 [Tanacetum coccineum]